MFNLRYEIEASSVHLYFEDSVATKAWFAIDRLEVIKLVKRAQD